MSLESSIFTSDIASLHENSSTPISRSLPTRQKTAMRSSSQPRNSRDPPDHCNIDLDSLSGDCRAVFILLERKVDTIVNELEIKNARLEKCEEDNRSLKEKVANLESQLEDIEAQNRDKNVILSGKDWHFE